MAQKYNKCFMRKVFIMVLSECVHYQQRVIVLPIYILLLSNVY